MLYVLYLRPSLEYSDFIGYVTLIEIIIVSDFIEYVTLLRLLL